jgi:hypothetical protein
MLQFYFLSIVANLLAGLALSSDYLAERFSGFAPYAALFDRKNVRTSVGIAAFVIGFLKLLIPVDVPVVGDLLPALAGMAMGAGLVVGLIRERSGVSEDRASGFEKVVMAYRVPVGIAGLVIAVLHFLLPRALLL